MRFAASLLDLSTRTFMRRLAENGTCYQAVVDNVRLSKAKQFLLQTDEPMSAIARSIGIKNQVNFTRMFRRVAGLTPQQFQIYQMSPNQVNK